MDKKIILTVIFASLIFLIVGYIFVNSSNKKKKANNLFIPKKDQIVYYYGISCPHCQEVGKWMKENKVEEKIKIEKKEVYENQANAQELNYVAQYCGLSPDQIGVPFLYADGKCYIGSFEVEKILKEKIKN